VTFGLDGIGGLAGSGLWIAAAVFVRISAMIALVPAFGERSVPVRIRLALALAFTAIVAPAIRGFGPVPASLADALGPLLAEVGTGLFFGAMLRLFVLTLQIAGTIAAQSTSLSQIFGGSAGVDPMPAMGSVLVVGGLALAMMTGLHVRLAAYMIESYALVPFGSVPLPSVLAEAGLERISQCFALAFTLAAPFVVASMLYNVTLGVINRAMPQLMVAFVGAPAITAGGLALLALAAPAMLSLWVAALNGFLAAPFGIPQ